MRVRVFLLFWLLSAAMSGVCTASATMRDNIEIAASGRAYLPNPLSATYSADGKAMIHGRPLKGVVFDPTPIEEARRPVAQLRDMVSAPQNVSSASFAITYVTAGSTDQWDEPCYPFPSYAQSALEAAANVWAGTLNSSVPITIEACWAILGDTTTLGYSGSGWYFRDFPAAPRSNAWYVQSLANALSGYDLAPGYFDMHITFNSMFQYYYGTDGNVPSDKVDFMTVAMHEIGHGLHFFGTMEYSGGQGYWGYEGYPDIYDVFMRDVSGNPLLNYLSGSYTLGSILVSNNIGFYGSNAMAANGNQGVRMYAPSTWSYGSSYAHLDYNTFNNTSNQLMVYSLSNGEAIHEPGAVTLGLLKDLGWPSDTVPTYTLPTVSTGTIFNIATTSATASGTITSLGNPNPSQHGFCWNTTGNPTISNAHTSQGSVSSTGTYTGSLTGLLASTTYYIRAYATNSAGTAYGGQMSFTTALLVFPPTVSTGPVSDIGTTSASVSGTITSLGNPNPSQHGFCWNTTGNPTISNAHTSQGSVSATGTYTGSLTGLLPSTTYYIRAYASNSAGTAYGSQVGFTTNVLVVPPSVSTGPVSDIGTTSASGSGTITSLGNALVTQHGFCWNTTGNPTVANDHTSQGSRSSTGGFTGTLSDLLPSRTYYVRAYAVNSAGTGYGSQVSFKTKTPITPVYLLLRQ